MNSRGISFASWARRTRPCPGAPRAGQGGLGERWTLLIVRDAFFGVRRFGDFAAHLGIPRAVLAERLKSLTAAGVLARRCERPLHPLRRIRAGPGYRGGAGSRPGIRPAWILLSPRRTR